MQSSGEMSREKTEVCLLSIECCREHKSMTVTRSSFEARDAVPMHCATRTSSDNGFAIARG